jgi:CheY-like chemotaxis protein
LILLVDDNCELCEALSDFLSLLGHSVQCATNGDEALRSLVSSKTRPALILANVVMPVLDGWGLLIELHKDPHLADVPVVIMTGLHDITRRANETVQFPPPPPAARRLWRVPITYNRSVPLLQFRDAKGLAEAPASTVLKNTRRSKITPRQAAMDLAREIVRRR